MKRASPTRIFRLLLACLATAGLALAGGLPAAPAGASSLAYVPWVLAVPSFDPFSCWVFPRAGSQGEARALFACLSGPEAKLFLAFQEDHRAVPIHARPLLPSAAFERRENVTYRWQKGPYYQFRAGYPVLPHLGPELVLAAETSSETVQGIWLQPGHVLTAGAADAEGCAPLTLSRTGGRPGRLVVACADPAVDGALAIPLLAHLALGGDLELEAWSQEGRFIHDGRFYPAPGGAGFPIVSSAELAARLGRAQGVVEIEGGGREPVDRIYHRLRIALVHRQGWRLESLRRRHYVQDPEIYLLAGGP